MLALSCTTGARLEFGGKPLSGHNIPNCYGALQPTAIFVPLEQILNESNWHNVTTEVFGPVQVIFHSILHR